MSSSRSRAVDAARRPLGRALRFALPDGGRLPAEVWGRRHRWILWLLWAHIPLIVAFGLVEGVPLRHLAVEALPVAVLAFGAARLTSRPRWSAVVAALGLATCSAVLVHLASGSIEMHFHFFVMVGVMTLYQDWPPFLASLTYVIVHHSVIGTIAPESVFNHPAAQAHPLMWALVHGGFILAMSLVGVISWRMNETTQAHVLDRDDKLAHAQQIAGLGSWEWDVPTGLLTWSDQLFRLYGYEPDAFAPTFDDFMDRVHLDDRPLVQSVLARSHETLEPFDYDFRALMPDGQVRWLHGQGEITEVADGRPMRICGTAHDITARKLAEHDLEASRQASELIQSVAVAANQATSLDHAMQTGLTAVCEFTGWPVGQVHLVRDDGTGLRPAGIWHVAGDEYRAFRDLGLSSPVSPDGDLAGTVMRSRLPVWDATTAEDPLLRAAADELGLHARCAVPVVAGDDVVAVLEFFASDATAP
ncbi:MAG TPA: PAS domain-containing protein, partial [Acidimicrobiales bacterium]|nr:PAS domain-containing protein [Acidimicrobiales bacterium]